MNSVRYTPPADGLCAIEPKALEIQIVEPPKPRPNQALAGGAICVVEVNGPLCYAHPFLDTYEQIRARFEEACLTSASTIVLKVNSPGGDVAGAFDTARYMRARAEAAGKQLIGFTEASACSSGYALISAAPRVYVSDTGTLGSIGVIAALENRSVQNAALGLRHYVIASGTRKADGNGNIPMSEEALTAIAANVNSMAARFFALVAEHRGIEDAGELQAAQFIGAAAVDAGLADGVASWDSLVAAIAADALGAIPTKNRESGNSQAAMAEPNEDKKESARAALAKAAESDDKDESARAKRALAAWDDDEKKAKAGDPDDDKPKEDAKAKAEADEKEKEAKAAASAAAAAATSAQASALAAQLQAQAAELAALKAESEQRKAAAALAERSTILASRPDLAPAAIKALEAVPTAGLQAVLDTIPRSHLPQLARAPLSGDTSHTADRSSPEVAKALDEAFGLHQDNLGVVFDGVVQSFGVPVPKGGK
jgi:capsid assembly protease